MAKKELNKLSLFVLVLVLVNGVTHSLAQGYWGTYNDESSYRILSPWDVDQLPGEPRENFYRDLRTCLRVLTRKCNRQLYYYVFRKRRMSGMCCQKFVRMGRNCKDSLEWTLTHTQKYERYEGHIRQGSENAFNKCSESSSKDYGWY